MGLERTRLTKESAYGVFPTSPDSTVQQAIFLPSGNAMGVRQTTDFAPIKDPGFNNRFVRKIPGRLMVGGTIQSYLFPSQTAFWLDLAAGLVGSAPCYDLPSFSIDHLIDTDACAAIYNRYLGNKVGNFSLSCTSETSGMLVSVKADVIGQKTTSITGTDYPSAAISAYPADDPYDFFHTAANLTIGSVRTGYQSIDLSIKNVTKALMGEFRYPSRVNFKGREVSMVVKVPLLSRADRDAYLAGTKQAVSLKFDNGVSWVKLDMGATVNIDEVADDLAMEDNYFQTLTLTALVDGTSGTDLTITTGTDS